MSKDTEAPAPLTKVIKGGFCVGCGGCAVVDPGISIGFNSILQYEATAVGEISRESAANRVCPFAEGNPDEDELGRELYGAQAAYDGNIGYHLATYAGWVEEGGYRASGSSGGMGSWLLCELLDRGLVDRVIQVAESKGASGGEPLFRFTIASSAEEVRQNAKSRYYPVEISGVVREMLAQDLRYAVVGIPCFLKSLRLLARENADIRQRLKFTVGLVCGHLKSAAFAELLAWQCGIPPQDLRAIDFRRKIEGQKASQYGVTAKGVVNGEEVVGERASRELFGSNWGLGFFKYKACEFCDDVLAELADITIGDAWLPEYENDDRGTNIVVVRDPAMLELCRSAAGQGRIHLESLPVERVVASQDAGFRHRRAGLAYRLHLEDTAGRWHPPKRVRPDGGNLSGKRKQVLELRYRMFQLSHEAFREAREAGDLGVFMRRMKPISDAHGLLGLSRTQRVITRAKRICRQVLGLFGKTKG